MEILDGKEIAEGILARITSQAKTEPFDGSGKLTASKLRARRFLAAVLVGNDASSVSYLKQKEKTAKELGVDFRLYKFPSEIKNDDLREEVRKIAGHKTCGGVIVQLPLPEHVNAQYVLNAIPREKDVDVLGERSLGAFYAGRNPIVPPSVGVVEEILKAKNYNLKASSVAVVGVGPLVGKPISMWLTRRVRELRLLHRGSDFRMLKDADLVIAGAGKAGLIKPAMLKFDAGVIDFGYDGGKGDFDADSVKANSSKLKADSWYTPTPGGTGPILVAKLFENFYALNKEKDRS